MFFFFFLYVYPQLITEICFRIFLEFSHFFFLQFSFEKKNEYNYQRKKNTQPKDNNVIPLKCNNYFIF